MLFVCPACEDSFLTKFTFVYSWNNFSSKLTYKCTDYKIFPQRIFNQAFNQYIEKISPSFIKIYNESLHAECLGLLEVAGPGYRKAFEFLIKDYLIFLNPEDKNKIRNDWLSNCIKKIDYQPLMDVCERALWLGNDQVHYASLYEEYDLRNLKSIIMTAVSLIAIPYRTQEINTIERRR